jgi:hypothetical protein
VAKNELIQDASAENIDSSFKTAINEKIKVIDNVIVGLTNGKYKPSQILITDDPKEAIKNTEEAIIEGTNKPKEDGLEEPKQKLTEEDALKEQLKPEENAIQKPSTTEEVSPTGETGQVITESGEGVRPSEQGKETTQEVVKEKVEQLRAEEQAEYAAMENPKDKAERQKIYDKYDKLITPLLEQGKTEAPKVEEAKSVEEQNKDFAISEIKKGNINWDGNMSNPRPVLGIEWKEIRKGKEDLLNGKDTAAARKLTQAIAEAKKKGGYDFIAGGGKLTTDFFVPIFGSFAVDLTPAELEYVAKNEQQLSKEYDIWFENLSEQQKQDELNSIENGKQKTDINTKRKGEENVSNQEAAKSKSEEIKSVADLNEDNLETSIELLDDIEANKKKASRASKQKKAELEEKIAKDEAELANISNEANVVKAINDNFDEIKKDLKDKGLLKINC